MTTATTIANKKNIYFSQVILGIYFIRLFVCGNLIDMLWIYMRIDNNISSKKIQKKKISLQLTETSHASFFLSFPVSSIQFI